MNTDEATLGKQDILLLLLLKIILNARFCNLSMRCFCALVRPPL